MARISVVIPVYNVEKYIGKMVESVQKQTLSDLEIILIDDGSPDNSGKICDEYAAKDSRIQVIHKKNAGVGAARNDGLDAATGEWIIFCDSDDWLEADALEKLVRIGDESSADVVFGDVNLVYDNHVQKVDFYKDEFVTTDRALIDKLIDADFSRAYCYNSPASGPAFGYGGPWNKIVRRQMLLDNGIRFDLRVKGIFDDIIYTAYIFGAAKKVVYTHVTVYNYRQVSTSITRSYKANLLEINEAIFRSWGEFMEVYGSDGRFCKPYYANVIRRLESALKLYFFHEKNQTPRKEQFTMLNKLLEQEPYKTAIREVNPQMLHNNSEKLLLKAARCHSARIIYYSQQLTRVVKAIKNKQ